MVLCGKRYFIVNLMDTNMFFTGNSVKNKDSSQNAVKPLKKEDKDFTKTVDIVAGKTAMITE